MRIPTIFYKIEQNTETHNRKNSVAIFLIFYNLIIKNIVFNNMSSTNVGLTAEQLKPQILQTNPEAAQLVNSDTFEQHHGQTLKTYISDNPKHITCYKADTNRWMIIYKLFNLISSRHIMNKYHRMLTPNNIYINKSYELNIYDFESTCNDDRDCKSNIEDRVDKYMKTVTKFSQTYNIGIKNYNKQKLLDFGILYAAKMDWYMVGVISLSLLSNVKFDNIIEYLNSMNTSIERKEYICNILIKKIYFNCNIHEKIFCEFYDNILQYCFNEDSVLPININYLNFFYKIYFVREPTPFIIRDDGSFLASVDAILMYYILTHSFYNKNISIFSINHSPSHDTSGKPIRSNINFSDKRLITPDLLILGSWKTIQLPLPDLVPYINFSIDPFRILPFQEFIDSNHYPILEFNSYHKTKDNTLNVKPFDESLKGISKASGKKHMIKFDNMIKSFYLPYIAPYYIDMMKQNENDLILSNIIPLNFDTKRTHFMYITSNCNQPMRERLFALLRKKDNTKNNTVKRKSRSIGKCQKTDTEDIIFDLNRLNIHKIKLKWEENPYLYSTSKFGFAIENDLIDGYISEKIINVYLGHSIPIYWGPREIEDIFNKETFYYINDRLKNPHNPTDEEINAIANELYKLAEDNSDNGWKKYFGKPIFKNNKVPDMFNYKQSGYYNNMINSLSILYNKLKPLGIPIIRGEKPPMPMSDEEKSSTPQFNMYSEESTSSSAYNENPDDTKEEQYPNIKIKNEELDTRIDAYIAELKCEQADLVKNDIDKLICKFHKLYPNNNITQKSIQEKAALFLNYLAGGYHGKIYNSIVIDNNTIIIKINNKLQTNVLDEFYINFVLINNLFKYHPTIQLVPTYGIFKCSVTNEFKQNTNLPVCDVSKHTQLDTKDIRYSLVQKKIDGITLAQALLNGIDLNSYINGLKQIFNTLVILEESPHKIYHNDLHCTNIMITPDNKWYVIDFGVASFTLNHNQEHLLYNLKLISDITDKKIYSGLGDIMFLLDDTIKNTIDNDIKLYVYKLLHFILDGIKCRPLNDIYNHFTTRPIRSPFYDFLFNYITDKQESNIDIIIEELNKFTYKHIQQLVLKYNTKNIVEPKLHLTAQQIIASKKMIMEQKKREEITIKKYLKYKNKYLQLKDMISSRIK